MAAAARPPLTVLRIPQSSDPEDQYRLIVESMVALVTRVNLLDAAMAAHEETIVGLTRATVGVETNVAMLVESMHALTAQVEESMARRKLSSLSSYNPDLTPAGGIRLDADDWQRVVERIDQQEELVRLAEARSAGAREALEIEQAKGEAFRARLKWWLATIGAAGAIFGGLATTIWWLVSHVTIKAGP